MQRVSFQRFTGIFFCHPIERTRANEIYSHGCRENKNGSKAWAHFHGVEDKPLYRLPYDVKRGEEQERSLDEGGEAFHFAMAVEVIGIGGLVRDAHRKIGNHRGYEIQDRIPSLRPNS